MYLYSYVRKFSVTLTVTFYSVTVLFGAVAREIDMTFDVDNQNEPLCAEVHPMNNEVVDNREAFAISITSDDISVEFPVNPTSLLVFDDDCKIFIRNLLK